MHSRSSVGDGSRLVKLSAGETKDEVMKEINVVGSK
jgi:hypothetical protein